MRFAVMLGLFLCLVGCNSEGTDVPATSKRRVVRAFPKDFAAQPLEIKTVSVKVVGMMCPHGCFPQVESIITKNSDIESVELTPQLKSDEIDNPVVLVKFRGELDKEAITKGILEAGFESVEYAD